MHVVPATLSPNGRYRPFVPYVLDYQCSICGGARHRISGTDALVDSGSDTNMFPAEVLGEPDGLLFAGHGLAWDGLPPYGHIEHHGVQRAVRYALVTVSVFGIPIASTVMVSEPGLRPEYGILGTADLFRAFTVEFYWGHRPPFFTLSPVAGESDHPAIRPRHYGDRMVEYQLTAADVPALDAGLATPLLADPLSKYPNDPAPLAPLPSAPMAANVGEPGLSRSIE